VHPGYPHAGEDDLDAGVGEDRVEQRRVLAVPVADKEPGPAASVKGAISRVRVRGNEDRQAARRYSWTRPPRMSTRSTRPARASGVTGAGAVGAGTLRSIPRCGRPLL